ncbi:MAG: glycosyltransferase family 4 protein [Clostridia bacterium]
MKILLIGNSPAGMLLFREELIMQLRKENEIAIICPNGDEQQNARLSELGEFFPVEMERRGKNALQDIKLVAEYRRIVKKFAPDKLITYTVKCNIYGGMACPRSVEFFPNVTGLGRSFQGGAMTRLVTFLYKISVKKKAKKVFFENCADKAVFVERSIVNQENAIVLNGAGVNLDKFAYKSLEKNEVTKFVFVGRIMREKGVDELLWAIAEMKKINAQAQFVFLGEMEEDYRPQIDDFVARGWLEWRGMVANVAEVLWQSDCLVLPSYHEGMSNAILEACSCGRAVIASDINGCKEGVIDGESGFVCKVQDKKSLFDCLMKFVNLSWQEKSNFGKNGRALVEEKFDKQKVVQATIKELFE